MNPSKSFPIEQSYINLAIVETEDQKEKEKKLLDAKLNDEIIGTYEEIYGAKTKIEVKEIFERCEDQTKKILVLGRAGIGKTTFCRYVAYQWAIGAIWQQYHLVVLIRLRNLTENRYPPLPLGTNYSPIDLLKKEYFHHSLPEKDEKLLKEQFDNDQVLWLLDGYDEIVQNVPKHLQYLFEQLLETPHHIVTSRPYLNTLSYDVQLEITGFTDDNIEKYVEQFFDQTKDEPNNASVQAQKLLSFLKCNPRIWGIIHIPVNLELICSLWCDTDWSETTTMTVTTVYDEMIELLCRRYLEKQNKATSQMRKNAVYKCCLNELVFLETLAFHGMLENTVILRPNLLEKAENVTEYSLDDHPLLLNIGILKSFDDRPTGTHIEANKNHYFVHFSFQEHFAARYLVRALNGGEDQTKKVIDFIKAHKYDQRFELVLTFASGLLHNNNEQRMNLFWEILIGDPVDLIGLRHVELIISCIEEADCDRNLPRFSDSMNLIVQWIGYSVTKGNDYLLKRIESKLRRSSSLVNQPAILDTLLNLHQNKDPTIKTNAYSLICQLPISNPHLNLTHLHLAGLNDISVLVRVIACQALRDMGEKAATKEVTDRLLIVLDDQNDVVREIAWKILEKMGEKVDTKDVINKLFIALGDSDNLVSESACQVLTNMGEKVATNKVIDRLFIALGDTNDLVRANACRVLENMGGKTVTNEVIHKLLTELEDSNSVVSADAYEVLRKMGEKAATDEVLTRLLIALKNTNNFARWNACEVLKRMGEKVATNEVIPRSLIAIKDMYLDVRWKKREALGNIGEKATTNEVISRLLIALGDTNDLVRVSACQVLEKMVEKAATNEVIDRLLIVLEDTNDLVKECVCEVFGKMGGQATNEVIDRLLIVLENTNVLVRESAWQVLGKAGGKAATNEVITRLRIVLRDTNLLDIVRARRVLEKMGEKVATNEVITRLLIALKDTNDHVRWNARNALRKIDGKAVTNEMIQTLLIALEDSNSVVRASACEVLGNMGEKAATDKVISRLLVALEDTSNLVVGSACFALSKMNEKVATKEVINKLLMLLDNMNVSVGECMCEGFGWMDNEEAMAESERLAVLICEDIGDPLEEIIRKTVEKFLSSSLCMSDLEDDAVSKLSTHRNLFKGKFWRKLSPEKVVRAFLDTKISFWLPIIKEVLIKQGCGITVTENTIVVYASKEPVQIFFSNRELGQELHDYLKNCVDKLFERCE